VPDGPRFSAVAQHAIIAWLDWEPPSPLGAQPFVSAVTALLLELRSRRLFCPIAYLDTLLASGRLERKTAGQPAPKNARNQ
jgi:hypothetical protein